MAPKAPSETVTPIPGLTGWVGGKRNLASRLGAMIDAIPHRTYVEPFAGAGHVFFARSRRPAREVVNDANRELISLWRCCRRHPDELLRAVLETPYSRAEFERLVRLDPAHLTDIDRAARLLFLQRARFRGVPTSNSFFSDPGKASSAEAWRRRFQRAAERLAGVLIEQRDFQWVIERFDGPDALLYLDPPYWGSADLYGKGCFGPADYERLRAALGRVKGRFILSLNAAPEVRSLFAGFSIETIATSWSSRHKAARAVTELVISGGAAFATDAS